jgi:hypothetical protein
LLLEFTKPLVPSDHLQQLLLLEVLGQCMYYLLELQPLLEQLDQHLEQWWDNSLEQGLGSSSPES